VSRFFISGKQCQAHARRFRRFAQRLITSNALQRCCTIRHQQLNPRYSGIAHNLRYLVDVAVRRNRDQERRLVTTNLAERQ
jgi:hypothetical protein